MTYIMVDKTRIRSFENTFRDLSSNMKNISGELSSTGRRLDWEVRAKSNIDTTINSIQHTLDQQAALLTKMSGFLSKAYTEYEKLDREFVGDLDKFKNYQTITPENKGIVDEIWKFFGIFLPVGVLPIATLPGFFIAHVISRFLLTGNNNMPSFLRTYINRNGIEKSDGITRAYVYNAGFNGQKGLYKVNGDFYGLTATGQTKAQFDLYNSKNHSFDPSLELRAQGNASVAEANMKNTFGNKNLYIQNTTGISALNAKGEAGFDFGLWKFDKNGNRTFDPGAELVLGGSVSALEGKTKTKVGNDDFGVFAGGTGKVGTAKAEAKAEFDPTKRELNVKGEVGAAVLEGEAEGGFTLWGYDIGVGVTGKALAAGAEFEAGVDNGEFVLDIGAALGVGGDLKITIGKGDD